MGVTEVGQNLDELLFALSKLDVCFANLLVGLFAFGDVAADADESNDGSFRVPQRDLGGDVPALVSVGVDDDFFLVVMRTMVVLECFARGCQFSVRHSSRGLLKLCKICCMVQNGCSPTLRLAVGRFR